MGTVILKALKIHVVINWILYILVYLIKTFCIWEFTNPFQWVVDLPTYDSGGRFIGLILVIFWQGAQFGVIFEAIKPKPIKSEDAKN